MVQQSHGGGVELMSRIKQAFWEQILESQEEGGINGGDENWGKESVNH